MRAWPSVAAGPVCAGLYKPMHCVLFGLSQVNTEGKKALAFVAGAGIRLRGCSSPEKFVSSCFSDCLSVLSFNSELQASEPSDMQPPESQQHDATR